MRCPILTPRTGMGALKQLAERQGRLERIGIFGRACLVASVVILVCSPIFSQVGTEDSSRREILEEYAKHLERVRHALPPHSGIPPLLDLSKPNEIDGGAGKKWEDRFTGSMGVRPIDYDPGVTSPDEATSISTTTTEFAGQLSTLPGRSCSLIVVAAPLSSNARVAYNHRFVYSLFKVELLEFLKGGDKRGIRKGEQMLTAQLGGSIRFRSGHEAAFVEANEGFVEVGKQYLLFLWKPVPSSKVYMVDEAYLLEDRHVFPITFRSEESRYSSMDIESFIHKVKAAIAKNADIY